VLPTSSDDGLVEFVPSTPLSKVLSEHRTIHKYFLLTAAQPSGKMCAGWGGGGVHMYVICLCNWSQSAAFPQITI